MVNLIQIKPNKETDTVFFFFIQLGFQRPCNDMDESGFSSAELFGCRYHLTKVSCQKKVPPLMAILLGVGCGEIRLNSLILGGGGALSQKEFFFEDLN